MQDGTKSLCLGPRLKWCPITPRLSCNINKLCRTNDTMEVTNKNEKSVVTIRRVAVSKFRGNLYSMK